MTILIELDRPVIDADHPMVDIVFIQDYSDQKGAPKLTQHALWKVAEYLTQWDFGAETDAAHTEIVDPLGTMDDVFTVDVGGRRYWISAYIPLDYVALMRRPIDAPAVTG